MIFGGGFAEKAIKTAKVFSLLTNPLKVLESAIKTAKVWQFVYVATKLAIWHIYMHLLIQFVSCWSNFWCADPILDLLLQFRHGNNGVS